MSSFKSGGFYCRIYSPLYRCGIEVHRLQCFVCRDVRELTAVLNYSSSWLHGAPECHASGTYPNAFRLAQQLVLKLECFSFCHNLLKNVDSASREHRNKNKELKTVNNRTITPEMCTHSRYNNDQISKLLVIRLIQQA